MKPRNRVKNLICEKSDISNDWAKMDFVINGQMVLKQPGSYLEKG